MPGKVRAAWRDYDNKTGRTAAPVATVTAGTFVALDAAVNAFHAAAEDVTVGDTAPFSASWSYSYEAPNFAQAASPLAQRENKWLCRFQDAADSQKPIYRVEIPCADLTQLANNSEFLDLTAGTGLALKTAWDALVVTRDPVPVASSLLSVQYVGRNM